MSEPYDDPAPYDDTVIVYEVATPVAVGGGEPPDDADEARGGSAVVLLAVVGLSVAAVAIAHRLSDS